MWNLYEEGKELEPLVFSNGKSQADVVKEVMDSIKEGYKIIFIKGVCGSGKSAIALNLARKIGKTSIVVPIKSLQEQYRKDYSEKKYVMNNGKKLKISSIFGRNNFKCKFLEENPKISKKETSIFERNMNLEEAFNQRKSVSKVDKETCDNDNLPCKIEIKDKNFNIIKNYLKQNPSIKLTDFSSINDVRRMSIAPVCPYWSPIIQGDYEIKKFKDCKRIDYKGLNNKLFTIYQRKEGCGYYNQYLDYSNADVFIFNSLKYKIETLIDRKPSTELEIIDECDDFLDSFSNEEQINVNRLMHSLGSLYYKEDDTKKVIERLLDILNTIKKHESYANSSEEDIFELKGSLVEDLLKTMVDESWILDLEEVEDSSYVFHLYEVSRIFKEFFEETFFSISKKENNFFINIVTINLERRLKDLLEKNKVFVMMSGTIHSEEVLKNIFGLSNYKIIEAEANLPGKLIKCKYGYELDCSYASFKSGSVTREEYLKSFSKSVDSSKKPLLVHVNSFLDLPSENEKELYQLKNLMSYEELIKEQNLDPLGNRISNFKNKKTDVLFTTRCSRGIDFPGEICNSIILTKFPYPNISSIFWKILKKTKPEYFASFYLDKAKREYLQKIYRGLRSKEDKVYLLSPDIRVIDFDLE